MHFTVHGKKLYSAVQYINISLILSSEMSISAPKTMEKTCSMPIINSFLKKTVLYSTLWYKIVQYCAVHKHKCHFKFRNEFLDPKNHGKDI